MVKASPPPEHPLARHIPTAEAVAALLQPHAEVVIHDLANGRIFHIVNAFSRRRVGDDALVDQEGEFGPEDRVLGPYEKAAPDGRRLKSVTAVLHDARQAAIGLLCINLDVSPLENLLQQVQAFIAPPGEIERPESLFRLDWRERINLFVRDHLKGQGRDLSALGRGERIELVQALARSGAFEGPKAADYVAGVLKVSRASVYNYLNAAGARPERSES